MINHEVRKMMFKKIKGWHWIQILRVSSWVSVIFSLIFVNIARWWHGEYSDLSEEMAYANGCWMIIYWYCALFYATPLMPWMLFGNSATTFLRFYSNSLTIPFWMLIWSSLCLCIVFPWFRSQLCLILGIDGVFQDYPRLFRTEELNLHYRKAKILFSNFNGLLANSELQKGNYLFLVTWSYFKKR